MAKVLITGGAGFIGSHLADALIAKGYEVAVVDTLLHWPFFINPKVKFFRLDIRSPQLGRLFDYFKPDYVFHLAAQVDIRVSLSQPAVDAKINLNGSSRVLEQAIIHQVKKFIFFSTGGVYGETGIQPATENSSVCLSSPYVAHKFAFEQKLCLLAQAVNLSYVIFRPGNVFGPRQMPRNKGEGAVIPLFLANIKNSRALNFYGTGEQTRDFIYVSDVVNACLNALALPVQGIFNLGHGQGQSILNLAKNLAVILGLTLKQEFLPKRPGEIEHNLLAASKAKHELGWQPQVFLEQGLRATAAWFAKNNFDWTKF